MVDSNRADSLSGLTEGEAQEFHRFYMQGFLIFTAIAVFKRPYMEVIRGTPPFIFMLISVAVLLIFFPQIALFLRDLAFDK